MKCPGCNEPNEAGMQFCIYCGHGLVMPPPSAVAQPIQIPSSEDIQARALASSQTIVLICTVCSKTDPLNGQFCVFCGGRTVSGSAAMSIPTGMNFGNVSQTVVMAGQTGQADLKNLSEELPRVAQTQQRGGKSNGAALIIWVLLAIILGAGSSIGALYFMKDDIQKAALHAFWPTEGLLVFSSAPNADVRIEDSKQKSLIFGKTSANGTLYMPSIETGAYELRLSNLSGQEMKKAFNVNVGETYIIGYPSRIELK